jgi:hypothetical protein
MMEQKHQEQQHQHRQQQQWPEVQSRIIHLGCFHRTPWFLAWQALLEHQVLQQHGQVQLKMVPLCLPAPLLLLLALVKVIVVIVVCVTKQEV